METIDLWLDPRCPWAWIASRWLLEAERVRDVRVEFHVMSLVVLNEGREIDPWYREWLIPGMGPARVATAVGSKYGPYILREFYTALGTRIHLDKAPIGAPLYVAALVELGLDPVLADAADSSEHDEALLASHHAGMGPVGDAAGTPVIHVAGSAFFGPVVSPAPRGEQAGLLWDAVRTLAGIEGFSEIKRPRDGRPLVEP
ncbi:disulfide bond formation protein DsbA [Longispora sp. NPDC051575]|uniref:mycothiol-dependent nitroreductase Rv2466c family protein n=1 Tax=Longispora sp. NPDC051575 TaxID=3154943 RepID=UPI0034216975